MKRSLRFGVGPVVLAGGLFLGINVVAQEPSPGGNPGSQSPSSSPASQPTDRSMDQMQRQGEHMDNGAKKMSKSGDEAFAMKAAQGGAAEMKMGKLATEKASDPDVKAFGQQLVDDHGKANEQLMAVAKEKKMTLPTDLSPKHQKMYDKLSQLSGAEFDKAFVKGMVKDHQEDVKLFTKESEKGKDEKIKGFASQTLPVIQGHLEKVKGLEGKMAGPQSTK